MSVTTVEAELKYAGGSLTRMHEEAELLPVQPHIIFALHCCTTHRLECSFHKSCVYVNIQWHKLDST